LIKDLKQEAFGDVVLLQRNVEVNVIAIIAEFQTNWRVSVVIPFSAVSNGSHLQPDRATFEDSVKVV
jgi:hypothetical protein